MEANQARRAKEMSHKRFEEEKECRLVMLYHRFIPVDDQDWALVREKLIHMRERYGSKQAVQLCSVCLSLFLSNSLKKHERISIGSLFLRFNPADKTPQQIAEVFEQHGRIKKKKNGEILVGVPAFNQICIPDHRWLKGSTMGSHGDPNDKKKEEKESKPSDTSRLKKRPPETQKEQQNQSKSVQIKQNNKLWRPTLKAVIPALMIDNTAQLNTSPFKQSKSSKRAE